MKVLSMHRSAAVALLFLGASLAAHSAVLFDQNVTPGVIFGSGNANGSFTVETASGVELGLRAKLRHDATGQPQNIFNSNGDGTYSFAAGVAPTQAPPTAVWSFEWTINVNTSGTTGLTLDDLTYTLGVDTDPGAGASLLTFDPINAVNPGAGVVCWDHATGTNATTDATEQVANCSAGNVNRVADYAALLAANHVAQNSWKPHWFIPGFDPTVDGTYDFVLSASRGGTEFVRTSIQVIVGDGAAEVPAPGSLALVGLGVLGLASMRRRRRN